MRQKPHCKHNRESGTGLESQILMDPHSQLKIAPVPSVKLCRGSGFLAVGHLVERARQGESAESEGGECGDEQICRWASNGTVRFCCGTPPRLWFDRFNSGWYNQSRRIVPVRPDAQRRSWPLTSSSRDS